MDRNESRPRPQAVGQTRLRLADRLAVFGRRQWRFLAILFLANFFDHYDLSILGLALHRIQASLGVGEAELGPALGLMRLGALPVMLIAMMADRLGRRRLLLVTILGFTLCTAATAFAQDLGQFLALQFCARFFIGAETLLAVVVLTEELSARHRGFGIGLLGALAAAGTGLASILFGFIDVMPYGWRALYLCGAMPLAVLAWFRRGLLETERFDRHARTLEPRSGPAAVFRPLLAALRAYPRRMLALSAVAACFELSMGTAYLLSAKHLQEVHGYSPASVTVLTIVGGIVATLASAGIGLLSDRIGRRVILILTIAFTGLSIVGFYTSEGPSVAIFWASMIFAGTSSAGTLIVLGAELFPLSHRSTASALLLTATTIGGAVGLGLEGFLYELTGSHGAATSWLAAALVIPIPILWFGIPETARIELEEIAPERS